MTSEKHDFYGKEVADAIKSACATLKVPQEELDIEVLETGTTGIFGLIRKKARIRVSIKEVEDTAESEAEGAEEVAAPIVEVKTDKPAKVSEEKAAKPVEVVAEQPSPSPVADEEEEALPADDGDDEDDEVAEEEGGEVSPESLEIVKAELHQLVTLMGFPSEVAMDSSGMSIECTITGEFEEELIGPEGKTLDSIQYLLRKMVARKCPERLRVSVNVGDFRERRLEELKVRAVELAAQVKEDGKTQVIPALNPSERREIHMILQEDKDIRSRSVGDGLFKKILIYKPGKGNRGGRKKPGGRGRRGRNTKNTK